jgi:aminoglycoside/choline kinase family phosphotransferase
MDAPPAQEDCRPFLTIAGHLHDLGLNAPEILATNLQDGFLLLSDLGTRQYLDELRQNPQRADALYSDAIEALLKLQREGAGVQGQLPPYSTALLQFELSLFHDWLCEKHLGIEFSKSDEKAWQNCCDTLIKSANAQKKVFVHRDYHSRNLMLTAVNNPGILDFQDAVEGPYTYDLVSLLKDCYIRWPDQQVRQWALSFYEKLDDGLQNGTDQTQFFVDFELMGIQRHLKAAGIFARLLLRDGKPAYLKDVPRILGYLVDAASTDTRLHFLVDLIQQRCLPRLDKDRCER